MDGDESEPIRTLRVGEHEVLVYWYGGLDDPGDDNIDIEVRTGDGRYSASVFTLRNVVTLLDKFRATGERPTSYLRCPDAIIVDEPITLELVREIVADAVATGDLETWPRLEPQPDDD